VCVKRVCVKRDLVCVKRDLVCVKRDLVCVKRVCVKRDLVSVLCIVTIASTFEHLFFFEHFFSTIGSTFEHLPRQGRVCAPDTY